MKVIYLGFNSFKTYKRGVENVIDFQAQTSNIEEIYYVHWGDKTAVYKSKNYKCISIKHCWFWPLILNIILFKIKKKSKIIIHSHNPIFSFFLIFKTNILTVHDALYYLNKSKKQKFVLHFYIIEKILYYRCSQVHFISEFTKNKSLFGNRENFVIIYNSSHFESLVSSIFKPKKIKYIRNILIIRSIEERARFDLLLDVANDLINGNYVFTIAGKGPLLSFYKQEILNKNLDNVKMLGYVPDSKLLDLYLDCDLVLIIAEYGEGFGLPIIEGYLFNKPVIASNICAIPEVIKSSDYLFDNTKVSIIKAIKHVENDSHDVVEFRSYYNTRFSNLVIGEQLNKLYLSVI